METHPDPARALSDGPNAWPLQHVKALLHTLKDMDDLVKRSGFAEDLITKPAAAGSTPVATA